MRLAEKDMTEKTLESFNDVFADILNAVIHRGKEVIKPESLRDAVTHSVYKADGKLREQDRDVAKYVMGSNGRVVDCRIALAGIENQTEQDPDEPLRVISYDAAGYRDQLGRKERYPVFTLVLYFGDTPWSTNRSIYEAVNVPEEFRPFVQDYKINVIEVARLTEGDIALFHSDFQVVVDYFVRKRGNPGYRPVQAKRFDHPDELLRTMSALTGDRRFEEVLQDAEGGKLDTMSEVLDYVEQRGIQTGIRTGIQQGIRTGEDNKALAFIRSIMDRHGYTAQEAMDFIGVDEDEQLRYAEMLNAHS